MTVDEKVAIQNLVIQRLQADAQQHPTLLLDALLSGDGIALVHSIVAQEEAQARERARLLGHLLGLFKVAPETVAAYVAAQRAAAVVPAPAPEGS